MKIFLSAVLMAAIKAAPPCRDFNTKLRKSAVNKTNEPWVQICALAAKLHLKRFHLISLFTDISRT